MKALYFGSQERQLYGVYHPVEEAQVTRETGVLICPPWLNEHNLSHRALKNLATSLAKEGFPALRFDYYGTGDSAGDTGAGGPSEFAADTLAAAAELEDLAGTRDVCMIGRGLGALAALLAAETRPVRHLVLWEPVIRGEAYARRLARLDRRQRIIRLQPSRRAEPNTLLGFPFPARVREAFRAADACTATPQVRGRCLIVVREQAARHDELLASLRAKGVRCELQVIDDDRVPGDVRSEDTALLASKPLVAIVKWLEAVEQA